MSLESATYVNQLVSTNPSGSDSISQGDDHLKLIKAVMKTSFPDVDQAAATVIVKGTAPTTLVKGTIWYNTADNVLNINTATTGATASWSAAFFNPAVGTAFRATMSAPLTVPVTDLTVVTFNTDGTDPTSFDLGDNFAPLTFKYTIPNTGYYYLSAATRWTGDPSGTHAVDDDLFLKRTVATGSVESTLVVNSSFMRSPVSPLDYIEASPTYHVEGIFHLNATDTVHVAVYAEYGGFIVTGGDQSYFQGFQLA